jgi:hypothetical protein
MKTLIATVIALLAVPLHAEDIDLSLRGMLHRMNCTAQFNMQCDSKTGYCMNLPVPSSFYFDLDGMTAQRGDSSSDYANLQQPKHRIIPTFATPNPQFDKLNVSRFSFSESASGNLTVTIVSLPNRTVTFSVDAIASQPQHTSVGVENDTGHIVGTCFLLGPDGQRN